jgi:hypothetical protein
MKKLVVRLLLVLIVLLLLAILAVSLSLDSIVKRGVETIGPELTKVSVKLDSVGLSVLSGAGKLKGLVVGNPEGFKTASSIDIGTLSLAVQPGSLLKDKLIVKSIELHSPQITYETDLRGNNLSKILANLESATGGGASRAPAQSKDAKKANRKLQVDDFLISGGVVHVSVTTLGGKSVSVPLPEIHLKDLGTGPDGITPAELTQKVLAVIVEKAAEASATAVSQLGKGALDLTKGMSNTAVENVGKITKDLGGLFKKKN